MFRIRFCACLLAVLPYSVLFGSGTVGAAEYLHRIQAGVQAFDVVRIRDNVKELCDEYPASPEALEGLLLQGDFSREVAGDQSLAKSCYEKITKSDSRSTAAAAGKIALADMAWRGTFKQSISVYENLIRNYHKLTEDQLNHIGTSEKSHQTL